MVRQSHIERNARMGQTSGQLAERNWIRRLLFYGALGGVAGGLASGFVVPSYVQWGVVSGVFFGLGLAIAIGEKAKRAQQERHARHSAEMARNIEHERQAMIEVAKRNGSFDRWDKSE